MKEKNSTVPICPRCKMNDESIDHLFRRCEVSYGFGILGELGYDISFTSSLSLSIEDWLSSTWGTWPRTPNTTPWSLAFAIGLWSIWKWRCKLAKINHIYRKQNAIADRLAGLSGLCVHIFDSPSLLDILADDAAGASKPHGVIV